MRRAATKYCVGMSSTRYHASSWDLEAGMAGHLAAQLVAVRRRQALHRRTRYFPGSSVALKTVPRQESADLEQMVVLVPAGWAENIEGKETSGSSAISTGCSTFFGFSCWLPNLFQTALSAETHTGRGCRTKPIVGGLPSCRVH